jgi:hypothetical protein
MKYLLFLLLFPLFTAAQTTCIKPTVSAGSNATVDLNIGYVTFVCTATSQNGSKKIASYFWTQLSGATCNLVNASTKTLTVDFPAIGNYSFMVDATDSCGAYNTATVNLSVITTPIKDSISIVPKKVHAGTSVVATVFSIKTGNVTFICNSSQGTQTHVVNKTSTSPVSATFTTKGWAKKTYTIVAAFANGSTVLGTFIVD